jgi:DNA-binding transcriptional ArsR family regulator
VAPEAPVPEPGTPGNPLKLTDPRLMRALAHPARIAIWQYLGLEGPATATECAEVVGMSPSACSYHLRALARFGFAEEDPASAADGRQRPWRARVVAFSLGDEPLGAARMASNLLRESRTARFEEVRADWLDHSCEFPAEWRAVAGLNQDVVHVTPDELGALRTRVHELLGEYRRLDQAERPAEAQRVLVGIDVVPWFAPEAGQ